MKFASCILLCLLLLSVFCTLGISLSCSASSTTNKYHSQDSDPRTPVSTYRYRYMPMGDLIDSPRPKIKPLWK